MWKPYLEALIDYGITICNTWIDLGYKDSVKDKLLVYAAKQPCHMPHWLGDKRLHASHRSNLLRKDFNYYAEYGWTEPTDLPYYYPLGND